MCTCGFGCCEVLISDQGHEFVNKVKEELFRLTGTEHRIASAYHPQTNGLTERYNQTLQTTLVKVVNDIPKLIGMSTFLLYCLHTAQVSKGNQAHPF